MKEIAALQVSHLRTLVTDPLFHKLMDVLSIGMSVVDASGVILYVNKATYGLYGLDDDDDVTGRRIDEIFPDTARGGVLKALETQTVNKNASVSLGGGEGLCARYPILNEDGTTLCCLTEVITGTAEKQNIDKLLHSVSMLRKKVDYYVAQDLHAHRLCTFETLIGDSCGMRNLKALGNRFAKASDPVLILGESGTGKELVAQALHQASPRADKVFLSVNCAALPPELAESELFGYEEGAFTGSKRGGLKGKFELAHGGTIFLDEIGEIPLPLQAKLLRVLEHREVQKIGSTKPVYADFRLVAATNRNLPELVARGQFRADLYHRLSALELLIPPLRERMDDFSLLTAHLLGEISGAVRARKIRISPAVLRLFQRCPWDGNIRELKNVLTYAHCCMEDRENEIQVCHLPPRFLQNSATGHETEPCPPRVTLLESSISAERQAIEAALQRTGGNKRRAAEELGISRNKLYQKLKRLGMDRR